MTEVEISLESKLRQVVAHEEGFANDRTSLLSALGALKKGLNEIAVDSLDTKLLNMSQTMKTIRECKVKISRVCGIGTK